MTDRMSDPKRNRHLNAESTAPPAWFKFGVLAFIVIVILCLVSIFVANSEKQENPSHSIAKAEFESNWSQTDLQNKQPLPVDEEINGSYRELRDRTIQLGNQVQDFRNQGKRNQAAIEEFRSQLAEQAAIIETLQNSLADLNTDFNSLTERIKTIKTQIAAKKNVRRKSVRRKSQPSHPPFTLVTIDYWNHEPNAVIKANGQLHALRQGAMFLNWTIQAIDTETGNVTLQNDRGQMITLL